MTLTTERKVLGGFLAALCLLAAVLALSVHAILRALNDQKMVAHTYAVIGELDHLVSTFGQTAGTVRYYATDPQQFPFDDFLKSRDAVEATLNSLHALAEDDPALQAHLADIQSLIEDKFSKTTPAATMGTYNSLWRREETFEVRRLLEQASNEERAILNGQESQARRSANITLYTIAAASIVGASLMLIALLRVLADLKQRRLTEGELEKARSAAETANRAKSAFLANMSHELRTPLTSILGYTDLLLTTREQALRDRYTMAVRRSGEHLLTLINDILDLSKIEAGRLQIENVECRLPDILADVDSLIRPRAIDKNIQFSLSYYTPVPEKLLTDPTRLRQILINLLSNAVKFTDAGAIRLSVRYELGMARSHLVIDVDDTGIGMNQGQINTLFEPFSQADLSTTRKYGGTGLGLSISRRLARMLGGDLSASSSPNVGSSFRLSLPIELAPNAGMTPAGDLPRVAVREEDNGRSGAPIIPEGSVNQLRVLLAEDGPENRDVLTLQLSRAGCTVSAVNDGRAAVEAALAQLRAGTPFDIILMDMQMPVMDGYSATAALRSSGYTGKIVALTANAMSEDRDRCFDAGCDEYAAKPVNMPELVSRMVELLEMDREDAAEAEAEAAAGEDVVLRDLTQKFLDGLAATLEGMAGRLREGKLKELAGDAHRLSGAGGSYGFPDITTAARAVEQASLAGEPAEKLAGLLQKLTEAVAAARGEFAGRESVPGAAQG